MKEPVDDLQHALFRVLKSLVFRHNLDSPLSQLPVSQLRCLHTIAHQEMPKMQELAARLEIKLPALSQIVDRLVKRGLVERHADPADRRVVRLGLTKEARAILAEAHAERHARLLATMRNLDAGALPKVIEGLDLLAAAAERVDQEPRGEASPPLSPDEDPLVEMMARRARTHREHALNELEPSEPETTAKP